MALPPLPHTANPAADLELPKVEKRLPRAVLTAHEAEEILNQPDLATPIGLRDRAVLEILYSTGMRRQELTGLCLYDLDWQRGTVMIRKGKGKKDRLLPLGARAAAWLNKYLEDARPKLVVEPDERELFLCLSGRGLTAGVLGNLVHGYVKASGVNKTGSCHLFRHAMATLMLENGADLRFIQQMLGHAKLNTTEIYTYVNIKKLIEVHHLSHPADSGTTGDFTRHCLSVPCFVRYYMTMSITRRRWPRCWRYRRKIELSWPGS